MCRGKSKQVGKIVKPHFRIEILTVFCNFVDANKYKSLFDREAVRRAFYLCLFSLL